jgi:hypothetical protein
VRPRLPHVALLLWACALLRLLTGSAPGRAAASTPPAHLPPGLEGEAGHPVALAPSERVLAAAPGVSLERRRYGSSEAALLSTTGLRELHPPTVCLRASGLEVVERGEEPGPAGCVGALRVRAGQRELHFRYVFFDGRTVTCKVWRRAVLAARQQLSGRPARWSMLQVMDGDASRARRRLLALLDAAGGKR